MKLVDRIKKILAGTRAESSAPKERPQPSPEATGSVDEVEQTLRAYVARVSAGEFAPDEIASDAALFDEAYIDSISSARLLTLIEETWGVAIEEVELVGNLGTVRQLAEHVHARPGGTRSER